MVEDFFNSNDSFRYLKNYYNLQDTAEIYGVSRLEIKHSNFLAWILNPKNSKLGTLNMRNLLKVIQNHYKKDNSNFKSLNLNDSMITLSEDSIKREKHNIDLFITFQLDNDDYAIILENKIYSGIHDNQLLNYYNTIETNYTKYNEDNIIRVFLYTDYQDDNFVKHQKTKAITDGYIPITYQDIYENVLLPILDYSTEAKEIFLVSEYIHCLANYTDDTGNGIMIITKQDRKCLANLFQEDKMLKFITNIRDSSKDNEYLTFYNNNKSLFLMCFNKYRRILLQEDKKSQLIIKLETILHNKKYILHTKISSKPYRGIAELLSDMLEDLSAKYDYDKLDSMFNNFYSDPLFVPVGDILNVSHPKWFTTHEKTIHIYNKDCYVLSSWGSSDYEELKNKINELNIEITLE